MRSWFSTRGFDSLLAEQFWAAYSSLSDPPTRATAVVDHRTQCAARAARPDSQLEVFSGLGHFPHVEAPTEFASVTEEFMVGSEERRPHLLDDFQSHNQIEVAVEDSLSCADAPARGRSPRALGAPTAMRGRTDAPDLHKVNTKVRVRYGPQNELTMC